MIIEYIRYAIPEGRKQEFLEAYREASKELSSSPNCLAYEITQCTEQPTNYIVRIEWDSLKGHLVGFRKGPSFPAFCAKVKPFFEQIEEMSHYSLTSVTSSKPASSRVQAHELERSG